MANINTILDTLKEDFKKYIKPSVSPYKTSVAEVKRGIYTFTDIVNKPAICFAMDEDLTEDDTFASVGTDQIRFLHIYVYCFIDTDDKNDYTNLHQFIEDIKYFLKNDFTYKSNTYIGDLIDVIEGGAAANCGYFNLKIKIIHEDI